MKRIVIAIISVLSALAVSLWAIAAFEFEKNSTIRISSGEDGVYECREFRYGNVVWDYRYAMGPALRFHFWVFDYIPGSFAGGCEDSILMVYKKMNG